MKKIHLLNIIVLSMAFVLIISSCKKDKEDNPIDRVTMEDKGMYWEVHLDFTNMDHFQMGIAYFDAVVEVVPSFEMGADYYIAGITTALQSSDPSITYEVLIARAIEIAKNVPSTYIDEINGFASVLSGGETDVMGDGKLSRNEFLILCFNPDVCTVSACSAMAVYGDRSETGKTIIGRNTDWFTGSKKKNIRVINDETNTNAVIFFKNGDSEIMSFGTLGMLGAIVGLNNDGIFISNLYSETGAEYSAVGKRSVMMDIRIALENNSTIDGAAEFLGSPSNLYAYNHNMFIADENNAKVLENDFGYNRSLRYANSKLNTGINWDQQNAIACVNSFMLKGNTDNYTGNWYNTGRWNNFDSLLTDAGNKVDLNTVNSIMSYHTQSGSGYVPGDIYLAGTILSMAYSYEENEMRLWLGTYVEDPQYVTIPVHF